MPADAKAVGDKVNELKQDLSETRDGYITISQADIVQGSYGSSSPTTIVTTDKRLRTELPIHCKKDDVIDIKLGDVCNGLAIGYYTESGTWIGEVGWVYEDTTVVVGSDRLVVIAFRKESNEDLTPSDYDADTIIYTHMGAEVSSIKGSTELDYGTLISSYYIEYNTGATRYNSEFSCTDFIPVTSQSIVCNRPYRDAAGIAFYDADKGYISGVRNTSVSQMGVEAKIDCPADAVYMRLSIYTGRTLILSGAGNSYQAVGNALLSATKVISITPTTSQIISRSYVDSTTGLFNKYNEYTRTTYLPVYGFKKISVKCAIEYNVAFAFYDKYNEMLEVINSSNIGSYGYSTGTAQRIFEIPDGAYYYIATLRTTSYTDPSSFAITLIGEKPADKVVKENVYMAEYEKLLGEVLCIGDSLTEGYSSADMSYPTLFAEMTGLSVTNAGHSGFSAIDWWTAEQTRDFSQYDTYLIWLGTNAGLTDTLSTDVIPYESYTDYANTNTGSLCKIISKIISQNSKAKIYLGTVYITEGDLDKTNAVIYKIAKLDRYSGHVVGVCNNHDDTLVEITTDPINVAMHPYDDVHFGSLGNVFLANHWIKRIRECVLKNPTMYARADGGNII